MDVSGQLYNKGEKRTPPAPTEFETGRG